MKIENISDFIEKAGGSKEIAILLNVHQWTVQRWAKTGIPFKYWQTLTSEFRITVEDLARLNFALRTSKKDK